MTILYVLTSLRVLLTFFFFFLLIRRHPSSTLFPYTTLFRSVSRSRWESFAKYEFSNLLNSILGRRYIPHRNSEIPLTPMPRFDGLSRSCPFKYAQSDPVRETEMRTLIWSYAL